MSYPCAAVDRGSRTWVARAGSFLRLPWLLSLGVRRWGNGLVRYVIWGWAAVFDPDGHEVHDLATLQQLAGFVDAEDLYATDYIGGTPQQDEIAAALVRSGQLRFALHEGESSLRVLSTFIARRPLSTLELNWLRKDTLGQWSDGMGENVFVPSGPFMDFSIQPLDEHEAAVQGYPFVSIIESEAELGDAADRGNGT
jgi:hypothetical protein